MLEARRSARNLTPGPLITAQSMATQEIERERRSSCCVEADCNVRRSRIVGRYESVVKQRRYCSVHPDPSRDDQNSSVLRDDSFLARHIFTDALGPEETSDDCMAEVSPWGRLDAVPKGASTRFAV